MSDNKEKRYSIVVSSADEIHNRIAGTRDFVQAALINLGAPYKWSEGKQDFVHVEKMHDNHLVNAIKEEATFIDSMNDVQNFLNGVLLKEFATRLN